MKPTLYANIPTPKQFIELWDTGDPDDPMPFDWDSFWRIVLKTVGCGPRTRLWIFYENGELGDIVEVTLFFADKGKFGKISISGFPPEHVASWDWEYTPRSRACPKSDRLWTLMPSKTGLAIADTGGVHIKNELRKLKKICEKNGKIWRRQNRARWASEKRRNRRRFQANLDSMNAEDVPIENMHGGHDWMIRVLSQPAFIVTRHKNVSEYFTLDSPARPIRKGDKLEIEYPRSDTGSHPPKTTFKVVLQPKLVKLLLRANLITTHEAMHFI